MESEIDQSTVSGDPSIQDEDGNNSESDASGSELTERERSLEDNNIVSERRFPQVTGAVSSGSLSLPDVSESEDDPSLPTPLDSHIRDVRICQGPYQPVLPKYKVTVHRRKFRSFCSKW